MRHRSLLGTLARGFFLRHRSLLGALALETCYVIRTLLGPSSGPPGGLSRASWAFALGSPGGNSFYVISNLLGPSWGPLQGRLGPSWAVLGPVWAVLGASWAVLNAVKAEKSYMLKMYVFLKEFGYFCLLGPSWGVLLEASWGVLGASLAARTPSWASSTCLERFCGILSYLGDHLGLSETRLGPS